MHHQSKAAGSLLNSSERAKIGHRRAHYEVRKPKLMKMNWRFDWTKQTCLRASTAMDPYPTLTTTNRTALTEKSSWWRMTRASATSRSHLRKIGLWRIRICLLKTLRRVLIPILYLKYTPQHSRYTSRGKESATALFVLRRLALRLWRRFAAGNARLTRRKMWRITTSSQQTMWSSTILISKMIFPWVQEN